MRGSVSPLSPNGEARAVTLTSDIGFQAEGLSNASSDLPHSKTIQESFGGHDVSQVKASVGGAAGQAASDIGAKAYATGDKVAFQSGEADLHTSAHEAAHVVQQRSGKVPTAVGTPGDPFEKHADAVADKVVAGESAEGLLSEMAGSGGGSGLQKTAVQRHDDGTESPPENEVGSQRNGAPPTKAEAKSRHTRNQAKISRIIQSGLAQQADPTAGYNSRVNLLKNTCEWVDKGEAKLYVLTPVHDAHLRPACPANKNAYFDTRVTYDQSGADYNDALDSAGAATNDTGLDFKFPAVAGTMDTDGITMMLIDPESFSEGDIVHFFIHEVQHDADQHGSGDAWENTSAPVSAANLMTAPRWAYNNYSSEFRAYWMMNPEGSTADFFKPSSDTNVSDITITATFVGADKAIGGSDDVIASQTTAFSNARQEGIFKWMFRGGRSDTVYLTWNSAKGKWGWSQSYGYLPHYYAHDSAFKAFVDSYTQPVGGNLINSVRIQKLSEAIDAGRITPELNDLDALDYSYLNDRTQSKPFWDHANTKLSWVLFPMLEAAIASKIVPTAPSRDFVEVVSGDTLSSIAERYLHKAERWHEIYDLNKEAIGDNPDLIQVGQQFLLPPL